MEIPEHFSYLGKPTRLQEGDHIVFDLRKRKLSFARKGVSLQMRFGDNEEQSISFAGTSEHGDILVMTLRLLLLFTPFKALPKGDPDGGVYHFVLSKQNEEARPEPDLRNHPVFR